MTYERILKNSMAEYEQKLRSLMLPKLRQVLEAAQPGDEVPFIGDKVQSPQYDDYQEYRDALPERVLRALYCKEWFRHEAPAWAQPLLLRSEECIAVYNLPGEPRLGRRSLVAHYSQYMRGLGWHIERAQPFEWR
jgi:hypothetical protein